MHIYTFIYVFQVNSVTEGRKEIKKENKMRKKKIIKEQRDKLHFQGPIPKAGVLKAKEHEGKLLLETRTQTNLKCQRKTIFKNVRSFQISFWCT